MVPDLAPRRKSGRNLAVTGSRLSFDNIPTSSDPHNIAETKTTTNDTVNTKQPTSTSPSARLVFEPRGSSLFGTSDVDDQNLALNKDRMPTQMLSRRRVKPSDSTAAPLTSNSGPGALAYSAPVEYQSLEQVSADMQLMMVRVHALERQLSTLMKLHITRPDPPNLSRCHNKGGSTAEDFASHRSTTQKILDGEVGKGVEKEDGIMKPDGQNENVAATAMTTKPSSTFSGYGGNPAYSTVTTISPSGRRLMKMLPMAHAHNSSGMETGRPPHRTDSFYEQGFPTTQSIATPAVHHHSTKHVDTTAPGAALLRAKDEAGGTSAPKQGSPAMEEYAKDAEGGRKSDVADSLQDLLMKMASEPEAHSDALKGNHQKSVDEVVYSRKAVEGSKTVAEGTSNLDMKPSSHSATAAKNETDNSIQFSYNSSADVAHDKTSVINGKKTGDTSDPKEGIKLSESTSPDHDKSKVGTDSEITDTCKEQASSADDSQGKKESEPKPGIMSPESKASTSSTGSPASVSTSRIDDDGSPKSPQYESVASKHSSHLRSSNPLPTPDWYPPRLHTLGDPASYYVCNLELFDRDFILNTFGGTEWTPGFYWVPESKLPLKSYWMIDRACEPFMPKDPGEHGARLAIFPNDTEGPDASCYRDAPVFVRVKGEEGHLYMGQYTLLPEQEAVDLDTMRERIPDSVLEHWAQRLAAPDRPEWITKQLREYFNRTSESGPVEIENLRAEHLLAAFNNPETDKSALRFYWEYLQCVSYDEELYHVLFELKHRSKPQHQTTPVSQKSSASLTPRTPSRPAQKQSSAEKLFSSLSKGSGGFGRRTEVDDVPKSSGSSDPVSRETPGISAAEEQQQDSEVSRKTEQADHDPAKTASMKTKVEPAEQTATEELRTAHRERENPITPDLHNVANPATMQQKSKPDETDSITPTTYVAPHLRHAPRTPTQQLTPEPGSISNEDKATIPVRSETAPSSQNHLTPSPVEQTSAKQAEASGQPGRRDSQFDLPQDGSSNRKTLGANEQQVFVPPHLRRAGSAVCEDAVVNRTKSNSNEPDTLAATPVTCTQSQPPQPKTQGADNKRKRSHDVAVSTPPLQFAALAASRHAPGNAATSTPKKAAKPPATKKLLFPNATPFSFSTKPAPSVSFAKPAASDPQQPKSEIQQDNAGKPQPRDSITGIADEDGKSPARARIKTSGSLGKGTSPDQLWQSVTQAAHAKEEKLKLHARGVV